MDLELAPTTDSSKSKPLWWDNTGVIVIKAGDTLFRASRAILTKESAVFATMFSLPQDAELSSVETHNGDPYVELADSAEDMQRFLDATHLYREYYESPKSQTFPNIASILRLSTKYDVPHLRERCISSLLAYYPVTLKGLDQRNAFWQCDEPDNFAADLLAFDLARETDVPKLLPMIMYDIIRENSTSDIMFGKSHPTKGGSPLGISNAEDKRILFAALPKLSAAQIAANLSLVTPSYSQMNSPCEFFRHPCANYQRCNSQKLIWIANHGTKGIKPLGVQAHDSSSAVQQYDPLGAMHLDPLLQSPNTVGWDYYKHMVCSACVEEARTKLELARRTFWEELPGIFGLPGWKELLAPEELASDYAPPQPLEYHPGNLYGAGGHGQHWASIIDDIRNI